MEQLARLLLDIPRCRSLPRQHDNDGDENPHLWQWLCSEQGQLLLKPSVEDPTFISKEQQQQWMETRRAYLQRRILQRAVEQHLLGLDAHVGSAEEENDLELQKLDQRYHTGNAGFLMDTLLCGVDHPESTQELAVDARYLEQVFYPKLTDQLEQLCLDLVCAWTNSTGTQDPSSKNNNHSHHQRQLLLAKARNLPELVRQHLHHSHSSVLLETQQLRVQLLNRYTQLYQTLLESLCVLQELVDRFLCKHALQRNAAFTHYFVLILENIRGKLKCLEAELVLAVHQVSPDSNTGVAPSFHTCLQAARKQLDQRFHESQQERLRIQQALGQYQMAGPEFRAIVQEYHALQQQMHEVERDIGFINMQG